MQRREARTGREFTSDDDSCIYQRRPRREAPTSNRDDSLVHPVREDMTPVPVNVETPLKWEPSCVRDRFVWRIDVTAFPIRFVGSRRDVPCAFVIPVDRCRTVPYHLPLRLRPPPGQPPAPTSFGRWKRRWTRVLSRALRRLPIPGTHFCTIASRMRLFRF